METEEDDLLPSQDPENPCPKCGLPPWAPADGFARICECGWYWWLGEPEKGRYFDIKMPRVRRSTGES